MSKKSVGGMSKGQGKSKGAAKRTSGAQSPGQRFKNPRGKMTVNRKPQ